MYIDDIHPHGVTLNQVWEDTVKVIGALASAGFLLNLAKCTFLTANLAVLGFALFSHEYQLGQKALGKLLTSGIPRSQKELQRILGKFNYAARFIPNYQQIVRPLKALMNKRSDHKWTAQHTSALNTLLRMAHLRLKLRVADPDQPYELTVDVGEDDTASAGGVILSQGRASQWKVITMVGRDLTEAETKWTRPEQLLAVAVWGIRRLSNWIAFARYGVTIVLPTTECMILVRDKGVHAKLRALILEL